MKTQSSPLPKNMKKALTKTVPSRGLVVRARHPWQQACDAKAKLKAARAVAARRRELKWHKEHDDLSKLLTSAQTLKQYRKKKGLPLDAPPAKPWDFAKGKCPNDRLEPQPRITAGDSEKEKI